MKRSRQSTELNKSPSGGGNSHRSKKTKIIIGVIIAFFIIAIASQGGEQDSKGDSKASAPTSNAPAVSATAPTTVAVDKSILQASISQWSSISADGYTEETYKAFSDALNQAKAISEDAGATQSQVDTANKNLVTAHTGLKEVFNPDSYQEVSYKDVARNPDSYKGQKLRFTGKVLQVVEGTTETDLRIATDGGYDDVVFVGYDPKILNGTRVLEDDTVTVYGTCVGQYSYTSALKAKISLPGLYADNVEIH